MNLPGTNGIPRTADGEMASPEEFSSVAGKLGIGNGGTIIVYDIPNQHMGLVAWAFLYYGHRDVRLLDGGFEKWSREGRPVCMQTPSYPGSIFDAEPVEAIYCSLSHAKASHGRHDRFSGTRAVWLISAARRRAPEATTQAGGYRRCSPSRLDRAYRPGGKTFERGS